MTLGPTSRDIGPERTNVCMYREFETAEGETDAAAKETNVKRDSALCTIRIG